MLLAFNATKQITGPVKKAVKEFSNHPSILKINDRYQNAGPFAFQTVALDAIDKEVRNVNRKKTTKHKIFLQKPLNTSLMYL